VNIREWNKKNSEITRKYDALYHRAALSSGLSDMQHLVLYVLYSADDGELITQNDIAGIFGLPKQTLNSAISKLSALGWVTLTQCAGPRNKKTLALTDTGMEICIKHIKPLCEAEERALGRLTDEEKETFLSLHEKVYRSMYDEITKLSENNDNES